MPTHFQGTEEERRALDLFIKLARASDAFFARIAAPMQDFDLTPSQFGVLETLWHLGPLTPSQLADKHLKSRNNLSVVIENLHRDGLVERVKCAKDRRAQYIHLTDLGRQRIESVFPRFVETVLREVGVLTDGEQEQLSGLLKRLGLGGAGLANSAD